MSNKDKGEGKVVPTLNSASHHEGLLGVEV
jgi:hypothetical protein